MQLISVKTPTTQSDIYIGTEVLSSRLPILTAGQKNFVVTDSNVFRLYPSLFEEYFKEAEIFVLPYGEENKNFEWLSAILQKMTQAGMRRTSRLFAVGGGVVGDIAGLSASLYMRGISCVQIPTTLLAQVDSSVGGKTAIDVNGVKNVVGAFFQPQEVLIDPTFLQTIPQRELKCGIGEIVKYGVLNGNIFDSLQANVSNLQDLDFLTSMIYECVRHKAEVVELDEKELFLRKSLNAGHTTGHAIELSQPISHGESVLWGLYFETKLAIDYGICQQDYGNALLSLLCQALQLPPQNRLAFPDKASVERTLEKAKSDKKNTDDNQIKMAVAKCKNEWTILSLPFEEYKQAVLQYILEEI